MSQLKGYSTLTDEVLDLGVEGADPDNLLQIADLAATGHPGLIVYATNPTLQKWKKEFS